MKNLPGPPQGLQLPPQRPAKMDLFSTLNNVLFSIATDPPCNTQKGHFWPNLGQKRPFPHKTPFKPPLDPNFGLNWPKSPFLAYFPLSNLI